MIAAWLQTAPETAILFPVSVSVWGCRWFSCLCQMNELLSLVSMVTIFMAESDPAQGTQIRLLFHSWSKKMLPEEEILHFILIFVTFFKFSNEWVIRAASWTLTWIPILASYLLCWLGVSGSLNTTGTLNSSSLAMSRLSPYVGHHGLCSFSQHRFPQLPNFNGSFMNLVKFSWKLQASMEFSFHILESSPSF